jgi:hypothetical protein
MLKKIADFEKVVHRKIVHHDEFCYRLKLMYLFLLHVVYTGCLIKNASTYNFFIYYPISMNKKTKHMVFYALQNSHKIYFFGVIFNS